MKAQLVKREDRWDLYLADGSKGASTAENPMGKLSLKNCEAIANGYDLDDLAENETKINEFNSEISFKAGFQKALEILGDKKFSEDALYDSIMLGVAFEDTGINGVNNYSELKEMAVRRNTQTEWGVEIITEDTGLGARINKKIKLDSNGCLILKQT